MLGKGSKPFNSADVIFRLRKLASLADRMMSSKPFQGLTTAERNGDGDRSFLGML